MDKSKDSQPNLNLVINGNIFKLDQQAKDGILSILESSQGVDFLAKEIVGIINSLQVDTPLVDVEHSLGELMSHFDVVLNALVDTEFNRKYAIAAKLEIQRYPKQYKHNKTELIHNLSNLASSLLYIQNVQRKDTNQ